MEKDNGQTRWHYRYDGEHRLTEVVSQPRDRNRPQTQVTFRYDPLGRRISKTRRQMLGRQPTGKPVTTRFVWEGFRLLQEVHGNVPLTYVYSDQDSYDPLARIDGVEAPEIFWFHCQPNGTPERMTDSEGQVCWEGVNSAWGKLLRESETQVSGYSQNLRMQGQYLDRETGLHYNLFRYYDPDCGWFTQQDPIGLAGGINLYQYAPNALKYIDPLGLSSTTFYHAGDIRGEINPSMGRHGLDFNPSNQGGFYVTTDKSQAIKWAELRGHPTITQFDIPNSELDKLNIKVFEAADNEWAKFVTQGRANTLAHSYDAVSGPMLANPGAVKKGGKAKPIGSQLAIFSNKAATVFDRYKVKKRCKGQ